MKKIIFIICGLFFVNSIAFGQNSLEKDLNKSFKKYDLIKLDQKTVLEKIRAKQSIEVQAYGRYFAFTLTPNDLRAKNYRAVERRDNVEKDLARQTEVTTYKGVLNDRADSAVRFTVGGGGGKLEGFIYSGGEKFFVAQAKDFSATAQKDDVVVYAEGDLNQTVDLSADAQVPAGGDIEEKLSYGTDLLKSSAANAESAIADLKTLEIATEADYQWVSQAGGAAAANNEILGILNLVDGIYQRDLGLTVKVTFQHAWSSADPFSAASTQALLESFLNYWNSNYPSSQILRDTAHLFTGKFSNQGIAYSSVVCRAQSYAYGLTARSGSINHLIAAHEIGHNLGADHIDNSGACANSLMNPFLGVYATSFCGTSKSQINSYTASYGTCLNTAVVNNTGAPTRFDYDGDGRADISVFRPSSGSWYINRSSTNSYYGNSFGQNGDVIVPADFDGDKKTETAVFRPSNGTWYFVNSSTGQFVSAQFGQFGDKPVAGDFDGDGRADISVFRPSNGNWYRLNSSTGQFVSVQFGQNGDVPLNGDFDGDGRADAAVFRPANGAWYILRSSTNAFQSVNFGQAGDIPTAADFDGDRRADIAVYRPSSGTWYRLNSSNGSFFSQQFGAAEDRPSPADFDGDGKADLSVFRPSSGTWYLQKSSTGFSSMQFGTAGDVPTASLSIF